jgi:hypothetical protein
MSVNCGARACGIVISIWSSSASPRRISPAHRLSDQGNSLINAPSDLGCKFFKSLCTKRARRTLRGYRQYRCHGEMKPRMKGNGLIRDPEMAVELFDLAAQSCEVASYA